MKSIKVLATENNRVIIIICFNHSITCIWHPITEINPTLPDIFFTVAFSISSYTLLVSYFRVINFKLFLIINTIICFGASSKLKRRLSISNDFIPFAHISFYIKILLRWYMRTRSQNKFRESYNNACQQNIHFFTCYKKIY